MHFFKTERKDDTFQGEELCAYFVITFFKEDFS